MDEENENFVRENESFAPRFSLWPLRFRWENFLTRMSEPWRQWCQRRNYLIAEDEQPRFHSVEFFKTRFYGMAFFVLDFDPSQVRASENRLSCVDDNQLLRMAAAHRWNGLKARFRMKSRLTDRIYDFVFYLLDYDPTHQESGEVDGSISRALTLWFLRVFMTRWIEITGVLFVAIVGIVSYVYLER